MGVEEVEEVVGVLEEEGAADEAGLEEEGADEAATDDDALLEDGAAEEALEEVAELAMDEVAELALDEVAEAVLEAGLEEVALLEDLVVETALEVEEEALEVVEEWTEDDEEEDAQPVRVLRYQLMAGSPRHSPAVTAIQVSCMLCCTEFRTYTSGSCLLNSR